MSKFDRKMTDVAYIGFTRFCGIRGLKRVFATASASHPKRKEQCDAITSSSSTHATHANYFPFRSVWQLITTVRGSKNEAKAALFSRGQLW